jgi:spore coat polysaccharide biosynthesis protein SpsF
MVIEIFVQARMGSTRLPGKVMKKILDKPLLAFQIERLKQVKEANALVVLTTLEKEDDLIWDFCQEQKIDCFRGQSADVLDRYYQAAKKRELKSTDAIVRITSDCPLIDPTIIDEIILFYHTHQYDYVSNGLERTYPRGLDVEVFSFQALEEAWTQSLKQEEREHVTPYIYRHPEMFRLKNIVLSPAAAQYRWTVDTPEDFALIKLILEHLYPINPHFHMKDVLDIVERHPEWSKLNAHIEQRKLPS